MIIPRADFVTSATTAAEYPEAGPPEVAFCGRSNVGKSSCLNVLAQRTHLARVSKTPGRTRLINFFELDILEETRSGARKAPKTIRLVDLPGYGFASGPREDRAKWKKMIDAYLSMREPLKAFVVLIDGELGPQPSDLEMVGWSVSMGRRPIVVATKIDKVSKSRRAAALQKHASALALPAVMPFSAKEKIGLEELWKALMKETGLAP